MVRTGKMLTLSIYVLTLTLPIVAILVLAASHDATAGSTPPVTTTADSGPGSLRVTIAGASASETISFDPSLAGQTITLTTGPIAIAKNLTIAGPDGGITVSGNNSSRVFEVSGAVNVQMRRVHLTHGRFAAGSGAAIAVQALANLTFENGSVTNSQTTAPFSAGGAISVQSNANATFNNVEISGNTSASNGAGVYVAGTINLINVTISGNVSSGAGAGLVVVTPSEEAPAAFAHLTNVTITNNPSGGANGAAVFASGAQALATVNLTNTVVADQAVGTDCFIDLGAVINSLGHNIDSDGTCNLGGQGDQPSTDPMLQPLALNPPGMTRTHAIGPGSPAFNEGDDGACPETDQRGTVRPQGMHCDIGAYEAVVATPTATPTASATTTPTPTPSPSPPATATPAPSGEAPTPIPTGQTPTPTPTPSPGMGLMQGDNDCDVDVDAVDALKGLQHIAAIPFEQGPDCPDIGGVLPAAAPAGEPPDVFGDVDCDGDVDAVDALKILQFVAAIPFTQDEPCVDVGEVF